MLVVKALHIIFVVSWFAGLFYLGRLFIYHAEALEKPEPDRSILVPQFALMERRLWAAITNPAAIATFATGAWLRSHRAPAFGSPSTPRSKLSRSVGRARQSPERASASRRVSRGQPALAVPLWRLSPTRLPVLRASSSPRHLIPPCAVPAGPESGGPPRARGRGDRLPDRRHRRDRPRGGPRGGRGRLPHQAFRPARAAGSRQGGAPADTAPVRRDGRRSARALR